MGRWNGNGNGWGWNYTYDWNAWAAWAENCCWFVIGCCFAIGLVIVLPILFYIFGAAFWQTPVTTPVATPVVTQPAIMPVRKEFIRVEEPWDDDVDDLDRIIINNNLASGEAARIDDEDIFDEPERTIVRGNRRKSSRSKRKPRSMGVRIY